MKKWIHVRTEAQYDKVMVIFENKWWVWIGWEKPTAASIWNAYKKDTVVDYNNWFEFCDVDRFNKRWIEVISFEEFLSLEGKEEFKMFEKVLVRDAEIDDWETGIFLFDLWEDFEHRYATLTEEEYMSMKRWEYEAISGFVYIKKIKKDNMRKFVSEYGEELELSQESIESIKKLK